MHRLSDIPISAVLRDYRQANLDAAHKLADEFGLTTVSISHGDAFDRASLAATTPRPTIAITSGIYELFPDNAPVVWFILIGLSPVLTYQHHLIDIIGGLALAALCFHFVQDQPLQQPFIPNRHVGIYYAIGALALGGLAFSWKPCSLILLWSAFTLALVAAGYLWLGPGIYRKQHGRYPLTTWLLLGPTLIGQQISLAYYARRCNPYDPLTEHLWIGRRLGAAEARAAVAAGVSAVVDLTAELSESAEFTALPYLPLPILDLTAPTPAQISEAISFITKHSAAGIVYLRCKAGYSRTAAVAGAYLSSIGAVENAEQALARLREVRPSIIVRPEALAALKDFYPPLISQGKG